jgi:nucleoside-diphosphate-sugar epimerase
MASPVIALAGATGDLGARILERLVARGAQVRVVVRPDLAERDARRLGALRASVARVDPMDRHAMADALAGASCVVSALNGLRDVIVDRQGVLLDAAVLARVPRFIPSDYAADFTKVPPGDNRNFDLRREFMARADRADIAVTSVLNGAFMDMLGAEMPIVQRRLRRVLYWRSADQPLDFTTKDDVAAYTAAVALDPATPRWLRIAGDTLSARQLATVLTDVTGERFRTLRAGGMTSLGLMIRVAKVVAPGRDEPFPPWQGMQYLRDMFSGRAQLAPLDNARYGDIAWTTVRELFARRGREAAADGVTRAAAA